MASNLDDLDNNLQVVEILRRGVFDEDPRIEDLEREQIRIFLQRANLDIKPQEIFQNPMLPEIIANMDTQIENWSYQQLGSIAMLPPEIQLLVLSKMDLATLNNLARTNRYYQDLLHDPELLRLLSERFGLKQTEDWKSFRREYSNKYYTSDCDRIDTVTNCTIKAILYSEPVKVTQEMDKLNIMPSERKLISEAVGQRGSTEIYQIYQDIFTRKGYLVDKKAVMLKALEYSGKDLAAMISREWNVRIFDFVQPNEMLSAAAIGGLLSYVKFALDKGATEISEAIELAIQHHHGNIIDYIIRSGLPYNPYLAFYRCCTAKLSEYVPLFWELIITDPDYISHINDVTESAAEFDDLSFFQRVINHIKTINRAVILNGGRILTQAVLTKNQDIYNIVLSLNTLSSWDLSAAEIAAIRTHQIDILMELLSKVKIGREDVVEPNYSNLIDAALSAGQASTVILLLRRMKKPESVNVPNLTGRFLRGCPDAIMYLPQLIELGFEPTQYQYIDSITPTNGMLEFILNRGGVDANLLLKHLNNIEQFVALLRYVEVNEQQDKFNYEFIIRQPLMRENFENFATVMTYIPISNYDQIYFELLTILGSILTRLWYPEKDKQIEDIKSKLDFLRERFNPTDPRKYIDLIFKFMIHIRFNPFVEIRELISYVPDPKAALICLGIIRLSKGNMSWTKQLFTEWFYKIDPSDPYAKELWVNYNFIRYAEYEQKIPNWEEIMLNNILSGSPITLEYLLKVLATRRYSSDIQLKMIAHLDRTPLSSQISAKNFHFLDDHVYLTFVEIVLDLDPSLKYINIYDFMAPGFKRVSELLTLLDQKVKPGVRIFIDKILTIGYCFYCDGTEKYFEEQILPFLSSKRFSIHASTILNLRNVIDKYIDELLDITIIEQKDVEDIFKELSYRDTYSFKLVRLTQFMLDKKLNLDSFIQFLAEKDPFMSKLYLDESRYLIELSQSYMQGFKALADNPNQFVKLFENLTNSMLGDIQFKTIILYGYLTFGNLDLTSDMVTMSLKQLKPKYLLTESFPDFSVFIMGKFGHEAINQNVSRLYLTRYMLSPKIQQSEIDHYVVEILKRTHFDPKTLEGMNSHTRPYNFADFIIYWLLYVSPQVYMNLESKFLEHARSSDLRIVDYALDFCGDGYDTIVLTILNDMLKNESDHDCQYITKLVHKSMERHKSPEIVNIFYSLCKGKISTDMQQRITAYNLMTSREPCQEILEDYPIFLFKESKVYQINYGMEYRQMEDSSSEDSSSENSSSEEFSDTPIFYDELNDAIHLDDYDNRFERSDY